MRAPSISAGFAAAASCAAALACSPARAQAGDGGPCAVLDDAARAAAGAAFADDAARAAAGAAFADDAARAAAGAAFADDCLPGGAFTIARVVPEATAALNDFAGWHPEGATEVVVADGALVSRLPEALYWSYVAREIALEPGKRYVVRALMRKDASADAYLVSYTGPRADYADAPVGTDWQVVATMVETGEAASTIVAFYGAHAQLDGAAHVKDFAVLELVPDYGQYLRFTLVDPPVPATYRSPLVVLHGAPTFYDALAPEPLVPGVPSAWLDMRARLPGTNVAFGIQLERADDGTRVAPATIRWELAYRPDDAAIVAARDVVSDNGAVGFVATAYPNPLRFASRLVPIDALIAQDPAAFRARPGFLPAPQPDRFASVSGTGWFDAWGPPATLAPLFAFWRELGLNGTLEMDLPELEDTVAAEGLAHRYVHMGPPPAWMTIHAPYDPARLEGELDAYWEQSEAVRRTFARWADAPDKLMVDMCDEAYGFYFAADDATYHAGFVDYLKTVALGCADPAAPTCSPAPFGLVRWSDARALSEDDGGVDGALASLAAAHGSPAADPIAARYFYWRVRWWSEATSRIYARTRRFLAAKLGSEDAIMEPEPRLDLRQLLHVARRARDADARARGRARRLPRRGLRRVERLVLGAVARHVRRLGRRRARAMGRHRARHVRALHARQRRAEGARARGARHHARALVHLRAAPAHDRRRAGRARRAVAAVARDPAGGLAHARAGRARAHRHAARAGRGRDGREPVRPDVVARGRRSVGQHAGRRERRGRGVARADPRAARAALHRRGAARERPRARHARALRAAAAPEHGRVRGDPALGRGGRHGRVRGRAADARRIRPAPGVARRVARRGRRGRRRARADRGRLRGLSGRVRRRARRHDGVPAAATRAARGRGGARVVRGRRGGDDRGRARAGARARRRLPARAQLSHVPDVVRAVVDGRRPRALPRLRRGDPRRARARRRRRAASGVDRRAARRGDPARARRRGVRGRRRRRARARELYERADRGAARTRAGRARRGARGVRRRRGGARRRRRRHARARRGRGADVERRERADAGRRRCRGRARRARPRRHRRRGHARRRRARRYGARRRRDRRRRRRRRRRR